MMQCNSKQKQKGFTLIELVVVIAILAILAAFALPRFAQLSEQAHQSSIRATAGALAAGVALTKTQWVSNGFTTAQIDVQGFGNGNVDVSDDGWPTSVASDDTSPVMTPAKCQEVWLGVLQSNAPTVSGANPEYVTTVSGGDCIFTYQLDGQNSTIGYDADTGEITTTIN
ncbi:MAG: prepilin-type N-terminal cleavage/methylation domain-containing protein [Marinobacter sp.]|uniref:prepilin-type N-terminal cleavage/methylation domain-containing protein n=1 Tax=Marinobacter sp. TaxID=50741 RepID=UPI0029C1F66F|nr:prepilin-type N-terminal cleavage/methylation domain-containing protein [Marinobacter sp.]MDX5385433.1 prepilin-type N-terminal cleavage/methylation domain-containing protein [Marinobacter sp.]